FVDGLPSTIMPPFGSRANAAMSGVMSPASRTPSGLTSTRSDDAAPWIAPNSPLVKGKVGSRSTATRVTPGAISLSSSSHFAPIPYPKRETQVGFPPGGARLETNPCPTGSVTAANTIGMAVLRARRERPRRRATEQGDELAAFQLIELHSVPASQR